MPTARILISSFGTLDLDFDADGQPLRPIVAAARDDADHPLRVLYDGRRDVGWASVYVNGEPTHIDDVELHAGVVIAFAPKVTGCGGGKGAFACEMTGRIREDMANPFLTDEERARFASRNDESVWEAFWDESNGAPPGAYPLSAVKPKDESAA